MISAPLDRLLLETRQADRQIQLDSGLAMSQGKDECLLDDVGDVGEQESETAGVDFDGEPATTTVDVGRDHHVDVGGDSGLAAERGGQSAHERIRDAVTFKKRNSVSKGGAKWIVHDVAGLTGGRLRQIAAGVKVSRAIAKPRVGANRRRHCEPPAPCETNRRRARTVRAASDYESRRRRSGERRLS